MEITLFPLFSPELPKIFGTKKPVLYFARVFSLFGLLLLSFQNPVQNLQFAPENRQVAIGDEIVPFHNPPQIRQEFLETQPDVLRIFSVVDDWSHYLFGVSVKVNNFIDILGSKDYMRRIASGFRWYYFHGSIIKANRRDTVKILFRFILPVIYILLKRDSQTQKAGGFFPPASVSALSFVVRPFSRPEESCGV